MTALKSLLFLLVAPGTVLVAVPYLILRDGARWPIELGVLRFAGLPLIVAGVLMLLWCFGAFTFIGRGTPMPVDPPDMLVARGLYQYTRNPMYVSLLITLLGEALWFEALDLLLVAGLVWLMTHLFVVLYEEPNLRRRFGASYDAYTQKVGRWLPRIRGV